MRVGGIGAPGPDSSAGRPRRPPGPLLLRRAVGICRAGGNPLRPHFSRSRRETHEPHERDGEHQAALPGRRNPGGEGQPALPAQALSRHKGKCGGKHLRPGGTGDGSHSGTGAAGRGLGITRPGG